MCRNLKHSTPQHIRVVGNHRHMAEFATRTGLLAIPMQMGSLDGEHVVRRWFLTDEVEHRGMVTYAYPAEREAADRPEVVLELARGRALDRPVPRVVHARRHLVAQ